MKSGRASEAARMKKTDKRCLSVLMDSHLSFHAPFLCVTPSARLRGRGKGSKEEDFARAPVELGGQGTTNESPPTSYLKVHVTRGS